MKYACMQGGPKVEKYPFAIQFLGTYVIIIIDLFIMVI